MIPTFVNAPFVVNSTKSEVAPKMGVCPILIFGQRKMDTTVNNITSNLFFFFIVLSVKKFTTQRFIDMKNKVW